MVALPQAFRESILSLFPEEAGFFFEALEDSFLTSVRLNSRKPVTGFAADEPVEWCPMGRYLNTRPYFTFDPLFHAGAYYVQESSSMFLDHVVKSLPLPETPVVLDLCAAPGGKSTLLLDALPDSSQLVSNEVIRQRNQVLCQNLIRWGRSNVLVTQNDPIHFGNLKETFDLILVDAPCSGEGLWRRDPDAIKEWSVDAVQRCAARQERILKDVLPSLKPGGFLIYATCTFNSSENEMQVRQIVSDCQMIPYPIPVNKEWPIRTTDNFQFRFLPHQVRGEGFFAAVLQKPGVAEQTSLRKIPTNKFPEAEQWLKYAGNFARIEENGFVHALPQHLIQVYQYLRSELYIRQAGICMGKLDRNGHLIPDHALALSTDLSDNISRYPLNLEEALIYLRKESPPFRTNVPQGWYLAEYKGFGLGWMKVLSNRNNNYFPAEYRILRDIPA